MIQTNSITDLADAAVNGLALLTCGLGERSAPAFCETKHARTARIMIVDDEMINIEIVKAYLEEEGFTNFLTTTDSSTAIEKVTTQKPDILLLDINMPHISGLEILELMRSKKDLKMIPAIVLTASNDPDVKLKALRLGASDFLAKPVDPSELMLRVQNVLAVKAYQDHLADYSEQLEKQVMIRTQELVLSRQEAIHCLARAGEYRDDDTGHHVTRVGRYSRVIAVELGYDANDLDLLEQAAQLHDVGKIGIPDAILHKPGKLDPQEFDLMRSHCTIGRKIINPLTEEESIRLQSHASVGMQIMGSTNSPVLKLASVIAASHHEKWDGSGYPLGISGDDIPLEGRIVAVADVFDALSSARPYKKAFSIEKCLEILKEGRGSHFDADVLDAFLRRFDEILAIHDEYLDPDSE
ncbi:response regulator [Rubripirellula amarantea]|uniref:Cyclic di-GMP phosphodiesterase response regulator RpfG n=1 Tax=Rubripirellula amarantea TaxID=2527999 RepID=A0A5C5WDH7_9BACT|nr:HD domain-containing phosphohydrolase [Rubripirellula amarantea]MDA8744892.1 response regulator [Rubripirellula amarantea]TWT48193.1 Cyclic di-GMP phosphodiesterase response regulator RpfG [Rubripirellula amarantea]